MKKKDSEREELIKQRFCKNNYQKAIWDLAQKNSACSSINEFWSFLNGVDAVLSLNKNQVEKIKKSKKE